MTESELRMQSEKNLPPYAWLTGIRRRLQLWRENYRHVVGKLSCRAAVKRRRVGGLV
jgi:hypothetical protein